MTLRALWSIPLLTKVTPGVGLVWFLVRREWRSLAIALGFTGVIVLGSFLLAPGLWSKWVGLIIANRTATGDYPSVPIPLLVRLPSALVLVIWGARTDRRWTVLIATMIAAPVMWWTSLAMLAALAPMLRKSSRVTWVPSATLISRAPLPALSPS